MATAKPRTRPELHIAYVLLTVLFLASTILSKELPTTVTTVPLPAFFCPQCVAPIFKLVHQTRFAYLRCSAYPFIAQDTTETLLVCRWNSSITDGDIEENPGPSQCVKCLKKFRRNANYIVCSTCNSSQHPQCANLDSREWKQLVPTKSAPQTHSWTCQNCLSNIFPFHGCDLPLTCLPSPPISSGASLASNLISANVASARPRSAQGLTFYSINARSIIPKLPDLHALINSTNKPPAIIAICETWLDDGFPSSAFHLDAHYDIFRNDRNRHGGGVLLLCLKTLKPKLLVASTTDHAESIGISIIVEKTTILTAISYRPPHSSFLGLNDISVFLDAAIKASSRRPNHIILLGDLNVDLYDPTCVTSEFWDMADGHGLCQLVEHPTRITCNSKSLLDLVLTDSPHVFSHITVNAPFSTSDHNTVSFALDILPPTNIPISREVWLYNKANWQEARNMLRSLPSSLWENDDPNQSLSDFMDCLWPINKACVPSKTIITRCYTCPWLTAEIHREIIERDRLFHQARKRNKLSAWSKYKAARNDIANKLAFAKNRYFQKLLDNSKNNSKKLWSNVKAYGKNNASIPSNLQLNGKCSASPLSAAAAFNEFFQSCFNRIKPKCFPFHAYQPTTRIEQFSVTTAEVIHHIRDIKNNTASGHDQLSARMIKNLQPDIAPHLKVVFESSLKAGIFPDEWKIACISPIFKKGDKHDIANYRPIALLPIIAKLLERIVLNQLMSHLDSNKIISSDQFGFRKNSSTVDALIRFQLLQTQAAENKTDFAALFIDLTRAFESVPHLPLFSKLVNSGVCDSAFSWLRSYLTDRTQIVRVGGSLSLSAPVTSGVVQGSVLGPALFILYLNDISLLKFKTISLNLLLYADDITVTASLCNEADFQNFISDINKIFKWIKRNFLTPNLDKTEWILYSFARQKKIGLNPYIKLKSCRKNVTFSSSFKLLGVHLNNDSKPSHHIAITAVKARKTWGHLRCALKGAPRSLFRLLYVQAVRPILEYAAVTWNPSLAKDIHMLESVQLYICRTILTSFKLDALAANDALNLQTLQKRRIIAIDLFVGKIRHGLCATPFNIFSAVPARPTRSSPHNWFVPKFRLNQTRASFRHTAILAWNRLPQCVQTADCFIRFKNEVLKLHEAGFL